MCSSDCLIIIIFYSSILNIFVTQFLCIVRSCWLYLSYTYVPFFLLHTCNFKNLNVLFPKKKNLTNIPLMKLRWLWWLLQTLYQFSWFYTLHHHYIWNVSFYWNFVCFRHMYYVCTDLLMLHYNLFLMSFVFDIIYLI